MIFKADENNRITATVRGKITDLYKYADYRENSKGYPYYRGTRLDVTVETYETAECTLDGVTYRTPSKFTIDCYDRVLSLVGNPESEKPRIGSRQYSDLVETFQGRETDIYMLLGARNTSENNPDLYVKVVLDCLNGDKKPWFMGTLELEKVVNS